ncbi:MAG: SGNH/GDSL hydrolase family protein [Bacteroidales bacterium]|nr:SGNH/GDSL hydrolase family protein [Bacteroidales bacterium]
MPLAVDNSRRIEFIGNSITCGYGIEGGGSGLMAKYENFYRTYASLAAQSLGAEYHTVAQSGIGMFRNAGGSQAGDAETMYHFYNQTMRYNKDLLWDFNSFIPQVVTVNLGTNDFFGDGVNDSLFVERYIKFVDTLRQKYNTAKLVLLTGPMYPNLDLDIAVQAVVAHHKQLGDTNIYFFGLSKQTGELGYGGDFHPSIDQGKKKCFRTG